MCRVASRDAGEEAVAFSIPCINNEATINVQVVDANTAKVTIEAEHRLGIMRDICKAVNQLNLNIGDADVATISDKKSGSNMVQKTFLVRSPEGATSAPRFLDADGFVCVGTVEKVKKTILVEAISTWGPNEAPIPQSADETDDIIEPTVNVMKFDRGGSTKVMVRIEATDRPGLLCSVAAHLNKLGISIVSADITTRYGCVYNKLIIKIPEGTAMEMIRLATLQAITSK